MGLRILTDKDYATGYTASALYCSTTMWAIGPVMVGNSSEEGGPDLDSAEEARVFINWLPRDARNYDAHDLEEMYLHFTTWLRSTPTDTSYIDLAEELNFEI